MENKTLTDKRVEALAEYAHEAWTGWMEHLFSKCEFLPHVDGQDICIIPRWAVKRWQRQVATPYKELSEIEKESDRREAKEMLKRISDDSNS